MSPGTWAKENRRSNRAKVPWVIRSNDIIEANFNKAINDLKIVMIRMYQKVMFAVVSEMSKSWMFWRRGQLLAISWAVSRTLGKRPTESSVVEVFGMPFVQFPRSSAYFLLWQQIMVYRPCSTWSLNGFTASRPSNLSDAAFTVALATQILRCSQDMIDYPTTLSKVKNALNCAGQKYHFWSRTLMCPFLSPYALVAQQSLACVGVDSF